jgi:tetratricopeptide (TPR) repeat protein
LELRPASHSKRCTSLNNLASALAHEYQQTGQLHALEESIMFHQEALSLRPLSHPNHSDSLYNLSDSLLMQFRQTNQVQYLEKAISSLRESLNLLPVGHPNHKFSSRLGEALVELYSTTKQAGHLEDAMNAFQIALTCESSSVLDRFYAGSTWAKHANSKHPSALKAYQLTIGLLPQLVTFDMTLKARQAALSQANGLACNAASCAIQAGKFDLAVEFLEEGRAIFWSQALQLRTSMDKLQPVAPVLATKLHGISYTLEKGAFREILLDSDPKKAMTLEEEAAKFHHLSKEWHQTLNEIREIDGFHDFLLPKSLSALQQAASKGPIVILNASDTQCDGLIVTLNGVKYVPFKDLTLQMVKGLVGMLQIVLSIDGIKWCKICSI